MRAWEYMPGVPAAGHVTGGGAWHPGRTDGCPKCEPEEPRRRRRVISDQQFPEESKDA